jgi:hypothetical protein
MYHERDTYHRTSDCPIFLKSKKKMTQKQNQPQNLPPAKEINHISHWHETSQSSSSNQPLYQHSNSRSGYRFIYHRYVSPYYQPYNYTPHTNQTHTTQPAITYPPPPLQITCPTTNSQTIQPKSESNPLPPPPQHPEFSQQGTNFPIIRTIHTITRGSNLDFQNKR